MSIEGGAEGNCFKAATITHAEDKVRGSLACVKDGGTGRVKVILPMMVGTFGEFQCSTRSPEQVAPQLGVLSEETNHLFGGWRHIALELIHVALGVINKANSVELEAD